MAKVPYDLESDNSGVEVLARIMKALCETGSHFTDSFRLSNEWGRGVSLFLRIHVPQGNEDRLRELLGKGIDIKPPPKVSLNQT